jgi:hypothetical protein
VQLVNLFGIFQPFIFLLYSSPEHHGAVILKWRPKTPTPWQTIPTPRPDCFPRLQLCQDHPPPPIPWKWIKHHDHLCPGFRNSHHPVAANPASPMLSKRKIASSQRTTRLPRTTRLKRTTRLPGTKRPPRTTTTMTMTNTK